MGNRAEELRKLTIAGGGALTRHSMNQKTTKYIMQKQEKGFDRKVARAERRRSEQEQFLRQFQFDRAVGNTFNGRPIEDIIDLAPENILYVVEHIGEHERGIETYDTEKGTKVSITIVDFTRPNSKNSS